MHAEAVVDLVESEHKEVQFRQVQGDFSVLQGKFMLQEGTPEASPLHLTCPSGSCTLPLHIYFCDRCYMLFDTLAVEMLYVRCHCHCNIPRYILACMSALV